MRNEKGQFIKGLTPWNKKTPIKKECPKCLKEFFVKPSLDFVVHCSKRCSMLGRKLHIISHTEESKLKMSLARKGVPAWNKGLVGFLAGEQHYNWVNDKSLQALKHRMRSWILWKQWRKTIFERDNYTCQECGKRGGYLEPNHIIPLRSGVSRAFDINNGITLCRQCHKKTFRKEEQLANKFFRLIGGQKSAYC